VRLFIAIEIPQEIREEIAWVIAQLRRTGADVRWEETSKLHITLKFLGNVEEQRLARIAGALEEIARSRVPFDVQYAGIGRFPPKGDPRVVWIGVRDSASALQLLARATEESMVALGFEHEDRPFHPHVTIGRVKGPSQMRSLLRTMESLTFESQPTRVTHIALVKSELKPSGSVYTVLQAFEFTVPHTK